MDHKHWLSQAEYEASWSNDPSTKVGCVIVSPKEEIVAKGCNRFPENTDISKLTYDKPLKYHLIIHAEGNALFNWARRDDRSENDIVYITDAPCDECLKNIINCGLKQVYYSSPRLMRDKGSETAKQAIKMLIEASGITVQNGINGKDYVDELYDE